MYKVLAVSNRSLCRKDFLVQIENIAAAKPSAILLREKNLGESDYAALAQTVLKICRRYGVDCILHSFPAVAMRLGCSAVHVSFLDLQQQVLVLKDIPMVGASVHSMLEAVEAEKLGASYLIAGHIFATDCKQDSPPRGLAFLREVCRSVSIPVYAIGGITPENAQEAVRMGAQGVCVMSGFMECESPWAFMEMMQ